MGHKPGMVAVMAHRGPDAQYHGTAHSATAGLINGKPRSMVQQQLPLEDVTL